MNFQQLRYVREAVRQNLNLTEVANALYTSQSGVSKQIKELEDELGIEIFVRRGKRLTGLSEPGQGVLTLIERILLDTENLRRAASHYASRDTGRLIMATTHTQARYALPQVIPQFRELFPKVHLVLRQGSPIQIAQMVIRGEADLAIATEGLNQHPELVTFPCYSWRHVVIVPSSHPLATQPQPLTLETLAEYPIITYEQELTGRSHIDAAFEKAGLAPDIVLSAVDADVIKTYVELGLGVGIVAQMAMQPHKDSDLIVLDAADLFKPNTTLLGLRRGTLLRQYAFRLIEMFAPELSEAAITERLRAAGTV